MIRSIHFPCIYFIQAGEGSKIKIGYTTSLDTRKLAIEKECGKPTKVLGLLPGGRFKETLLHAMFFDSALDGEWFRPDPPLLDFIKQNAAPDQLAMIGRLDVADYWLAIVDCRTQRERCRANLKRWTRETRRLYREGRKRYGDEFDAFAASAPAGPTTGEPEETYLQWWHGVNTLVKTMDEYGGIKNLRDITEKHPEFRQPVANVFRGLHDALRDLAEQLRTRYPDEP